MLYENGGTVIDDVMGLHCLWRTWDAVNIYS